MNNLNINNNYGETLYKQLPINYQVSEETK